MITDEEAKMIVDNLFKEEEGQDVMFGEVKLVSEDSLERHLTYNDVKKIFNAYYKRVEDEEEKHAKKVFKKLKEDVKKDQDDNLNRQLGL